MPSFLKFFRVEDPVVMAVKVTTLEKILKLPPEVEVLSSSKLRPFRVQRKSVSQPATQASCS